MIVKHTGNIKLADGFSPCTEVNDALNYGIGLPWPYPATAVKDLETNSWCDKDGCYLKVHLDYRIVTKPNHSLLIMGLEPNDGIVTQLLETDWWPSLNLLIDPATTRTLEQGRVVAKAIVVPRCQYVLQPLSSDEVKRLDVSEAYIKESKSKYATRHDNAYAVLSTEHKRGRLPREIKPRSKLKPSTRW